MEASKGQEGRQINSGKVATRLGVYSTFLAGLIVLPDEVRLVRKLGGRGGAYGLYLDVESQVAQNGFNDAGIEHRAIDA